MKELNQTKQEWIAFQKGYESGILNAYQKISQDMDEEFSKEPTNLITESKINELYIKKQYLQKLLGIKSVKEGTIREHEHYPGLVETNGFEIGDSLIVINTEEPNCPICNQPMETINEFFICNTCHFSHPKETK